MDRRLGSWQDPPLAYVVAECAFAHIFSLEEEVLPLLQKHLGHIYPRTAAGDESSTAGSVPKPEKRWSFISADPVSGLDVTHRSIALHTTQYTDGGDFLERWRVVLAALAPIADRVVVQRWGLRYVDLIVPNEGTNVSDYVIEGLRGVVPIDGEPDLQFGIWQGAVAAGECVVSVRAGIPSPKGPALPPNLLALPLRKPTILETAEARIKLGEGIGFIDTDCIQGISPTTNPVLDLVAAATIFTQMHGMVSAMFRRVISPMALEAWK